jgi:hypothetical protein
MVRACSVLFGLGLATSAAAQEFPSPSDLGRLPGEPAPAPAPPSDPEPPAEPAPPKHPAEGETARIPEDMAKVAEQLRAGIAAEQAAEALRTLQGPHGADAPPRTPRTTRWDASGEARVRVVGGTDAPLDATGTRSGRTWWATTRLIVGGAWRPSERVAVELELEAINGQIAGPVTAVGTGLQSDVFRMARDDHQDVTRVVPRKANVSLLFPKAGRLTIGAQTFQWGLGLLANDGRQDVDFGDPDTGNVVARVAFGTQPAKHAAEASEAARGLSIFAAADFVLRDDNADVFRGDLAAAGLVGWRLQHPRAEAGMFGVARWQRDRLDPHDPRGVHATTLAFPVDAYLRALLTPVGKGSRLLLEAEGAFVAGRTTRPYGDETRDGSAVRTFGAVARLRYDHDAAHLTAKLEGGLASGDDDLRDGVSRSFSFHSDFQVGMMLFDQLLPLVTARSVDQASDPALVAQPSVGLRHTVNQGTVTNAGYLFPVLRWNPIGGLDLRAGWVAAWSAGRFLDVYQTGLHGGYATTPGGAQPGRRFLGHELDLSARYRIPLPKALTLDVGAEGALFLPGAAFDGLAGGPLPTQGLGRGRVTLAW